MHTIQEQASQDKRNKKHVHAREAQRRHDREKFEGDMFGAHSRIGGALEQLMSLVKLPHHRMYLKYSPPRSELHTRNRTPYTRRALSIATPIRIRTIIISNSTLTATQIARQNGSPVLEIKRRGIKMSTFKHAHILVKNAQSTLPIGAG